MIIKHFNINLRDKTDGFELNKENFSSGSKLNSFTKGKIYSEELCLKLINSCDQNYDLSMEYFKRLSINEFNQEIDLFVRKYDFKQVYDLSNYSNKKGYYLMVLDKYLQLYLGTSTDIKKRIIRHWSNTLPLDRVIHWSAEVSKISIDSFRALDTTRIFIKESNDVYIDENNYINEFSNKFTCNRTSGGNNDIDKVYKEFKFRKLI